MPNKAFTFIELAIVMLLISILSIISFSHIKNYIYDYKLRAAAQELYANIYLSKISSINQNKAWAIFFNPDEQSYIIYSSDENILDFEESSNKIEKKIYFKDYNAQVKYGHGNAIKNATSSASAYFPNDNISYNKNITSFSPNGFTPRLGYVYIQNINNSSYSVGITSVSGQVVLKRWNCEKEKWVEQGF